MNYRWLGMIRIIQSYSFINMWCHFTQCVSKYKNSEARFYYFNTAILVFGSCDGVDLSASCILKMRSSYFNNHLHIFKTKNHTIWSLLWIGSVVLCNISQTIQILKLGYIFPYALLATLRTTTWLPPTRQTITIVSCGLPYHWKHELSTTLESTWKYLIFCFLDLTWSAVQHCFYHKKTFFYH